MAMLTPKQENFVQAYLRTGNAYQAYLEAYDVKPDTGRATVDQSARRLLLNPKITLRLAEINNQAAEKIAEHQIANADSASYTVDTVTHMLQKAYDKAEKTENGSAAMTAAAIGLARVKGFIVNKQAVDHGGTVFMKHEDALAKLEELERRANKPAIELEAIEIDSDSDVRH